MERRSWTLGLVALVGVALALAGCGKSPVAPDTGSGSVGVLAPVTPPLMSIAEDGTVTFVTAPVSADSDSALAPAPTRAVTRTAKVDGSVGGTLRAGRFSVTIPPGAFVGPATVTVSMRDSTVMICDLAISPPAANKFAKPVLLTADLSAPGMTDASDCTNYWFDPTRLTWVSLLSKSRCSGALVMTNLSHFSKYGSGKAGW